MNHMNQKSSLEQKVTKIGVFAMSALGHLSASLLTMCLVVCLVVPPRQAYEVLLLNLRIPELRELGWTDGLMLWALGAAIWGLLFLSYKLISRRRAQGRLRTVKLSRGTIMTETVIILPVYMMLTFGLAQMSLNFIAGSLANVAGYMASRSYWVWEGEVNRSRAGTNVSEEMALERAKIAGALVMAAVAPGDFAGASLGSMNGPAEKARAMTAPAGFDSGELAAALNLISNFGIGETSYVRSFDVSSVLIRGALKFTHAYGASSVTKQNGTVRYTYKMLQSMPVVGRAFGQYSMGGPNGLIGYYWLTINRDYKLTSQLYRSNPNMPNSSYSGGPSGDGSISNGDILGESGVSW